jgi:hypothetical protein
MFAPNGDHSSPEEQKTMKANSILAEEPVTLTEAAKIFPGRPHKNTLRRFCHAGVRGVKLAHFYSGATLCTTRAAIDAFLLATNPGYRAAPVSSDQHRAAEAVLDSLGV